MGRIGRGLVAVAFFAAAAVGLAPASAQAEPAPGTVTATFADVCGFVRADLVNADPDIPDAAFIRFSRNGKLLDDFGQQINGGASAVLHQVAAAGDVIHYEWDVEGGGTESLDYTHVTPPGCDEPNLAMSLIDSCGPNFTIAVANTGEGAADVVVQAPTLHHRQYTVAPGSTLKVTVPAVAVSGAWVGRFKPGFEGDLSGLTPVDQALRAPGCGIPWPNPQIARFTPSCASVLITLYALDMKGLVHIYRNGKTVRTLTVDLDIYLASVALQRNDVVTIEKPALATYVHHPASSCPGAAPVVGPPPAAAAAVQASPSPSVPPVAPALVSPSASPSPEPIAVDVPAPADPPATAEAGTPVALITSSVATALVIAALGGWFFVAAPRRRRRKVWAVAFAMSSPPTAIRDTGFLPTMSVRWLAHPGTITTTVREDGPS